MAAGPSNSEVRYLNSDIGIDFSSGLTLALRLRILRPYRWIFMPPGSFTPVEVPIVRKAVSYPTVPSRFQASSPPTDSPAQASLAPQGPSLINTVRTIALVMSLTTASGCAGVPHVTNVEEDGGSIFCTFYHDRYPGEDEGTLRSTDDGISWTKIDDPNVIEIFDCDPSLLLVNVQTDSGGAMLVSIDAGRTWNSQGGSSPLGCDFVQAYHGGKGMFAYNRESPDGTIFRTRDRGKTWKRLTLMGC
jgi:photosystem II stability/assembly factor-like uncharacterized protein